MAFKLIKSPYPSDPMIELPISSLTLASGDMLELDAGAANWTVADSSTQHWQKKALVQQAATSSATVVKAIELLPGMKFATEVANAVNTAHNGDRMVLTDQNTVNNTGSDNTGQTAVFVQEGSDGTNAIGEFVYGSGVDPDAA